MSQSSGPDPAGEQPRPHGGGTGAQGPYAQGHGTQQPYAPQGYSVSGAPPYAPSRPTNVTAAIALGAGIAGLTVLPVLGSIVAVILGPMSRKEIRRTGEDGWSMTTAAIVTGWIGIGIGVALVLMFLVVLVGAFGFLVSFNGMTASSA